MLVPKRRSSLSADQLVFTFDVPEAATEAGDLAGLTAMVAASVARMLKGKDRGEVAKRVSHLLGESVSKLMLDAYASEARAEHNIPVARWLALIAATDGWDIADGIVKRAGARLLSGEEIKAAELGHLQAQMRDIETRIGELQGQVRPIRRDAERGRS